MGQKRLDERIQSLYLQREKYDNHPIFQREKVWSPAMKQSLIDTILRDMYIHPILIHERKTNTGETRFDIIDGQQRIGAIFEFMDGKFSTFSLKQRSRQEEPAILPALEPRKHYMQLSVEARNRFNEYTLHLYVLENLDDPAVGLTFRRVQNQVPLTMAEKLWSYTSKTTSFAIQLAQHPLWTQWYRGSITRKQGFQGSLYLLLLEVFQGYANLTTPRLRDIAAGMKDKDITDETMQRITDRMDVIMHVFARTSFTLREEVIPMYQAVFLMEREGYVFKQSEKGILSSWFAPLQTQLEGNATHRGFASLFFQLVYTNKQHDFWDAQFPRLLAAYQAEKTLREEASREEIA